MEFTPVNNGVGASVTLAATTTSAGAALPDIAQNASRLLVTNAGNETAFFRMGVGAQTAVATDLPIRANSSLIVPRGRNTHVAAIVGTTSATVFVTAGEV